MAAGVPSLPARAQPTARVPAGYPSDYIEVIARAQREGSVTVYGSTDLEIAQPLIDAFEARYPGIRVRYQDLNTIELNDRFIGAAAASSLLYEWTHFLTHTRYVPRGRLYRRIWKHHRLHHFKHEGYWFAFTVPWIDGWLGTGPDPQDVERSAHARSLGGDPRDV